METHHPLQELHAAYKAVRARIDAPRVIPIKDRPRPFMPSIGARFALNGRPLPTLVATTPKRPLCSTGPNADYHVRAYRNLDSDEPIYPKIAEVIAAVSEVSGVSVLDIKSQRRTAGIILPRQVAMYLCRTLTLAGQPEIGRRMGDRDHSTVHHAYRKVEAIKDRDDVAALISAATDLLRGAA